MTTYSLREKPRSWRDAVGYTLQFVFAVLTATILIATICGTSIAAGLVAAGIGTLTFLCVTGFKAPIVISNSGATVSAVVGALALTSTVATNFAGVIIGGAVIAVIYGIAALAIRKFGVHWLQRAIPPLISGTTILVIGITLAAFIPTYALVGGAYSLWGILVAGITALTTILCMHYGKGLIKTMPFLIGLLVGYAFSFILTVTGVAPLVAIGVLSSVNSIFMVPQFAFLNCSFAAFNWATLPQILISFGMVALAAMTEHVDDIGGSGYRGKHKSEQKEIIDTLINACNKIIETSKELGYKLHVGDMTTASAVTGYNLLEEPGLHKTLLGDGLGSLMGTIIGGQPNTTYSEYTSTMAISGVYSTYFTLYTALVLIALGFIAPFNAFLMALPNAVFAGVSIVAYGMIALAGLRTIIGGMVDFTRSKNQIIFAAMVTTGLSGLAITAGAFNLTGIALAMVVGVILNFVLRDKQTAHAWRGPRKENTTAGDYLDTALDPKRHENK